VNLLSIGTALISLSDDRLIFGIYVGPSGRKMRIANATARATRPAIPRTFS